MKMIKELLNTLVGDKLGKLAGNDMNAVELEMVGGGLIAAGFCEDWEVCCKCIRCC